MIELYVLSFSILMTIVNELLNRKLKIRETQKVIQEKIRKIEKIDSKELLELYRIQMRKTQISMLITLSLLLIYFLSLQPFEITKIEDNSTKIYIRNPLLRSSKFYIQSENFNGIITPKEGIITLNITEKPKIDVVVLTFPFNIPIINRNWIGIIGSFIIFSVAINLIVSMIKALIRFPKLEIKNG
ncbi:hypothetical protein BA065_01210 [Nanoarchaeota archaeon NZ13-N]|nr:MAG: hypothetical protein BA065_01210 [Nanoarchaeota archaeon NZ13-N]